MAYRGWRHTSHQRRWQPGRTPPRHARNTVTDIQLNQSTIQAGASFELDINRRTKINTNSSTNRGDAVIDTHGNVLTWYGSLQGGPGSLRVINSGGSPGLLIFGTDKKASINPFGSAAAAGVVNLTSKTAPSSRPPAQ